MNKVKIRCITCRRIIEIPYEPSSKYQLETCDAIAECCEKPDYIYIGW